MQKRQTKSTDRSQVLNKQQPIAPFVTSKNEATSTSTQNIAQSSPDVKTEINERDAVVSFDVEVFKSKNNYRTHRVVDNIKIDLQTSERLVSPKLTAVGDYASLSNNEIKISDSQRTDVVSPLTTVAKNRSSDDVNISNENVTQNTPDVKTEINGRDAVVSFDVEVFADKNNYRTHRVIDNIKIDLQNSSGLVSPKLTAARNNASLSNDVNISNENVAQNTPDVKTEIKKGDEVVHTKYKYGGTGKGKVVAIKNGKVKIKFGDSGVKVFSIKNLENGIIQKASEIEQKPRTIEELEAAEDVSTGTKATQDRRSIPEKIKDFGGWIYRGVTDTQDSVAKISTNIWGQRKEGTKKPPFGDLVGADNRSRTCMKLPSHGPEPCASANSAISAFSKKTACCEAV